MEPTTPQQEAQKTQHVQQPQPSYSSLDKGKWGWAIGYFVATFILGYWAIVGDDPSFWIWTGTERGIIGLIWGAFVYVHASVGHMVFMRLLDLVVLFTAYLFYREVRSGVE